MIRRPPRSTLFPSPPLFRSVYGRQGIATANMVNAPPRFVSKNRRGEFSVDKANQILDAAGWKRGPDGIRAALPAGRVEEDRKSTRLNSSHSQISYAVFCLKK